MNQKIENIEMKTMTEKRRCCLYVPPLSPKRTAELERKAMIQNVIFVMTNSPLTKRERNALLRGVKNYFFYREPLSVSDRRILWKIRKFISLNNKSLAQLALPPKDKRSRTSNKCKNYGKRNQL